MNMPPSNLPEHAVAVTGLAGRWPGAPDPDALWRVFAEARESVSHFEPSELEWSGATGPEDGGVRARGVLDGADLFDAGFFGITPGDADVMDPQHRLFLECAWEALEDAAQDPYRFPGLTGVFAGLSMNTYLLSEMCGDDRFARDFAGGYQVENYSTMLGNDKDFLPSRVSYKLNLRGPSIAVQTACSTSLVAVHLACRSLLDFECDMALAGGASITFPQRRDYSADTGGMVSPDGHCRAFDADANGTVFGHGVGVVALRRLEDAVRDGDPIHAVIRGSAVNNDGSAKVGFAAPGLDAQADVIAMALAAAGVAADSVSCVEAHGTGTALGDPIEVAALTRAFREATSRRGFCHLATGKPNLGHLDVAAGVTGLIKVCLQIRHGLIPPILHYRRPNPRIDFDDSPFVPVAEATAWRRDGAPRRAGVSAFGVGGTNAHLIVEEPPEPTPAPAEPAVVTLPLSARSAEALASLATRLADHIERGPDAALSGIARTLTDGRAILPCRTSVVAGTAREAVAALRAVDGRTVGPAAREGAPVAFLFPGQGAQRPGMARGLAEASPLFGGHLDQAILAMPDALRESLRDLLLDRDGACERIHQTTLAQPALFVVEYAMARTLDDHGIRPTVCIGHSVGEFVMAHLAGVMDLGDAARLVARRGELMQAMPPGAMLAVLLSERELLPLLPENLSLAAVNAPGQCVVSGAEEAVAEFADHLEDGGIRAVRLRVSHAFHSAMMDGAASRFQEEVAGVRTRPPDPAIAIISSRTGGLIGSEFQSPEYWARQLRDAVRFADAGRRLLTMGPGLAVECGPGTTLTGLLDMLAGSGDMPVPLTPLPDPGGDRDARDFASALGRAWECGVPVDWRHADGVRKSHLPTYPFQRKSHWVRRASGGRRDGAARVPAATASPAESWNGKGNGKDAGARGENGGGSVSDRLRALLLDLSGREIPADLGERTFPELGFDSLFLTQIRQAVRKDFGVSVTFRQLLGDIPSPAALARHIAEQTPPDRPAAPGRPAARPGGSGAAIVPARATATDGPMATATTATHGPFRAGPAPSDEPLTAAQEKALADLIRRYNAMTRGSKDYADRERAHFCDPRAASNFRPVWKEMVYPIVCARSKGPLIIDIDGNEFIDVTLGFGVHFLGHSPDFVVRAVRKQMDAGFEIGPQSPAAGEAARLLCGLTGLDRATFCNTGSEAVMAAMRVARTATARPKVAYFNGDYHGMFDAVLARGFDVGGGRRAAPVAPGIPAGQLEDVLVLDYGDPRSLELLDRHADELAAVMVEPVQARNPDLQPRAFLHELRGWATRAGALFIMDEIITGFRCCPGGASEWFGVSPDLATYGKIVGGGIPIGVLAGRREYMDMLDGGSWRFGDESVPEVGVTFFAGTFVRHPLAMAAARAVLGHLREAGPKLQERTNALTARLAGDLNDFLEDSGCGIHVGSFSSLFHLSLPGHSPLAGLLYYHLRLRGIHIWEGRVGFLSTTHTDRHVDRIIKAFRESVAEMQDAGFLPARSGEAGGDEGLPATAASPRTSPVTEAQREILLSAVQGDAANCAYNESNLLRLTGRLDVDALSRALRFLVDRHAALRSRFSEDGTRQIYDLEAPGEIALEDWSGADAADLSGRMDEARLAEVTTPFDLEAGPLVRMRLIRTAPDAHTLLFTAHHLVCDGWSFGMLVDELSRAYNAFRAGRDPDLPPAMSFADHADAEAAADHAGDRAYWLALYESIPDDLALPTDRPYPAEKTFAGGMVGRRLADDVFQRVTERSPELGGTVFATLFGVFAAFLNRLCGNTDLVIGVPAAAQTMVGCDELVGHCLNFLPLRVPVDPAARVDAGIQAARECVLAAYEHQRFTYGTLVGLLGLRRSDSRLPLVSVMFNIDRAGIDRLCFDGLAHAVETNPKRHVNLDLFFNLVQTESGLTIECEYNADLFDRATIDDLLRRFEGFVGRALARPDTAIARLPLVTDDEWQAEIVGWNRTDLEIPFESVVAAQARHADATPDADAVIAGDERVSHAELAARIRAIGSRLRAAGVGAGDAVGICLGRSADLVAAPAAVHAVGAFFVPIDPDFPAARVRVMVEDSGLEVALVDDDSAGALLPDGVERVDTRRIGGPADDFEPVAADPESTAYLIFTSGTTGRPKGVRVPHGALCNFLGSMAREPGMSARDTLLAVTTLSFDIALLELLLPAFTGARVVVADREAVRDPVALAVLIERREVTLMQATPATWRLLLEAGWRGSDRLRALCGGEALTRDLADRLIPCCAELWNMYGPTETTIWSACGRVRAGDAPVDIGRPIGNTRIYLLDHDHQPVPPGSTGQIFIAGKGLAEGYHGRPDLTAERFVSNPFADDAGRRRMYATGDLARRLPDGRIECLGRDDDQIKLRGFRIEPGEIEAVLESHPRVAQAVVVARGAEGTRRRLVAFVIPEKRESGRNAWRDQWEMLFEQALKETGDDGASIDRIDAVISGWAGEAGFDGDVEEWIETTVERVRALGPRRVVEVGCGTGQLLLRLAPGCEEYIGGDFVESAVGILRERVADCPQVTLRHCEATDWSGIPESHFDTVIINSVIQYFPGSEYLRRVVDDASLALAPGGRVFLGDVQHAGLLGEFHTASQYRNAQRGATVRDLRERVARRLAHEGELMADPAYFRWLASTTIGRPFANVMLRRGRHVNETTSHHFDVILEFSPSRVPTTEVTGAQHWKRDIGSLSVLRAMLVDSDGLAVRGIPDARLAWDLALHDAVAAAHAEARLSTLTPRPDPLAVHPEDLWELAEELGFHAHLTWLGRGEIGAIFHRPQTKRGRWPEESAPVANPSDHVHEPCADVATEDLRGRLRAHLAATLPEYMRPAEIIEVNALPLTPNGKVDRNALPDPGESGEDAGDAAGPEDAPRDGTERTLHAIWSRVLGLSRFGVNDGFFELGGDSILAFQIIAAANQDGLPLTPRLFFRHRTIAGQAEALAEGGAGAAGVRRGIQAVPRDIFRRRPTTSGS